MHGLTYHKNTGRINYIAIKLRTIVAFQYKQFKNVRKLTVSIIIYKHQTVPGDSNIFTSSGIHRCTYHDHHSLLLMSIFSLPPYYLLRVSYAMSMYSPLKICFVSLASSLKIANRIHVASCVFA